MFRRIVIAVSASSLLLGGVAQSANASTSDGSILVVANPVRPIDSTGTMQLSNSEYTNGITGTRIGSPNTPSNWFTLSNYSETSEGAATWYVIDLALDPARNKMYWIDYYGLNVGTIGGCAGAPSCGRLLYTTSQLGTSDGYANLSGLGIDSANGVLYVGVYNIADSEYAIKRVSMSAGGSIDIVPSAAHIPTGTGIGSLVLYNKKLYWTQNTSTEATTGVYWAAIDSMDSGHIANGSIDVNLTDEIWGLAIDRDSNKIYWANWVDGNPGPTGTIGVGSLTSAFNPTIEITTINCSGHYLSGPSGVAFDYHTKRITWGNWNYNSAGDPASARVDLTGSTNRQCTFIETNQAPMVKESVTVAYGQSSAVAYLYKPEVTQRAKAKFKKRKHAVLSCAVTFAGDRPEAHLYMAPSSVTYKWTRNGKKVKGSNATLRAKKAGSYKCTATATNAAGSTKTTSKSLKVKKSQAR